MNLGGSARPSRRARASGWLSWIVSFLLAVGLHAFWLWAVHWPAMLPSAAAAAAGPRLLYVGGASAAMPDAQLQRDLWSPVLFALPSEVGFSPREGAGVLPARPSLQGPPPSGVLLARASAPTKEPVRPLPSLIATVAATDERLDFPPSEPVFPVAGETTGFTLHVWWPDGEPDLRGGGGTSPRELAAWLDERPWEAQALITFDPQGSASTVFLERPTQVRERNEAIARGLRKLRVAPAAEARTVRVMLQYEQEILPAPRGPPPGGEVSP